MFTSLEHRVHPPKNLVGGKYNISLHQTDFPLLLLFSMLLRFYNVVLQQSRKGTKQTKQTTDL